MNNYPENQHSYRRKFSASESKLSKRKNQIVIFGDSIPRPLFSEKAFHKESITLINNNKTISNNEELAETFNKHFSKLVESLDIDKTLASNIASSDIIDPVFNAIKKYENHPRIKKN